MAVSLVRHVLVTLLSVPVTRESWSLEVNTVQRTKLCSALRKQCGKPGYTRNVLVGLGLRCDVTDRSSLKPALSEISSVCQLERQC